MAGPKAPKDPEKKRKNFYVMRNKDVAGSPQPDGRGIQFIYLDNGRLDALARLTGNITDEGLLGLLATAGGFRELVYSIGISAETDEPGEDFTFALQMYGKSDPYKSGTTISRQFAADGMENVVKLSEVAWSGDDDVPGQIRFEFQKAGTHAKVSVRFYLQDGFDAPEPEEEEEPDLTCDAYHEMLGKSLMQVGNNVRMKRVLERARRGEDVTVAFVGGSITQGAGAIPINTQCYAYKTFERFCALAGKGTDENIHYVKAGLGGTSSELGVVRYEHDVCADGAISPDLVIVEFAVNDEGDETKGECYDSLVRKIWLSDAKPAVVLLFAVFANDWNLQERLGVVGEAYHLPMVSVRDCVVEQFYKKAGEGRVFQKNQFFFDAFHPSNLGHTVMADCLGHLFETVDALPADDAEPDIRQIKAPLGDEFAGIRMFDRQSIPDGVRIDCGSFTEIDGELHMAERDMDLQGTGHFPHNWMHCSGKEPFVMDIPCSALMIVEKDSADVGVGTAQVFVDGKEAITIDPHEVGWTHCNALICCRGMENREHHVEIAMRGGEEGKRFTILGFGYVG